MTREVHPPRGDYDGKHKVYSSVYRDWRKLCQSSPGPMRRCYIELADNPYPPGQLPRHHRLKGRLKQYWEYEVSGGDRVRHKPGADGDPVVADSARGVRRAQPQRDVRGLHGVGDDGA